MKHILQLVWNFLPLGQKDYVRFLSDLSHISKIVLKCGNNILVYKIEAFI